MKGSRVWAICLSCSDAEGRFGGTLSNNRKIGAALVSHGFTDTRVVLMKKLKIPKTFVRGGGKRLKAADFDSLRVVTFNSSKCAVANASMIAEVACMGPGELSIMGLQDFLHDALKKGEFTNAFVLMHGVGVGQDLEIYACYGMPRCVVSVVDVKESGRIWSQRMSVACIRGVVCVWVHEDIAGCISC